MKPILLLALLTLAGTAARAHPQFGLAALSPDGSCAAFATPLPPQVKRLRMTQLDTAHRRQSQWVRLGPMTDQPCPAAQAAMLEGAAYYPLQLPKAVQALNYQVVYTDTPSSMPHVRVCSSQEGLWFSAWSAKGRNRLWHAYAYLGYDVQPNCTVEETE
ncbi:hypothetical protein [Leeia aquatica]|uniref:Uncharacterized protein n=1 Tax=Leeia aquatica TaxID=2725557 RepID=A0A847RVL3_9NEIS|nr:hypothetical protein [Leeia aquatica]NLR73861.1 hypothetical protein [Leeia aquatica]